MTTITITETTGAQSYQKRASLEQLRSSGVVRKTSTQFGEQITPRTSRGSSACIYDEAQAAPKLPIQAEPAVKGTSDQINLCNRGLVTRKLSGLDEKEGSLYKSPYQQHGPDANECEFFAITESVMNSRNESTINLPNQSYMKHESVINLRNRGLVTRKLSGLDEKRASPYKSPYQQHGPDANECEFFAFTEDDEVGTTEAKSDPEKWRVESAAYEKQGVVQLGDVAVKPNKNDPFQCFTHCISGLKKYKTDFSKGR